MKKVQCLYCGRGNHEDNEMCSGCSAPLPIIPELNIKNIPDIPISDPYLSNKMLDRSGSSQGEEWFKYEYVEERKI